MNEPAETSIIAVYTDGGAEPNQGAAGYATIIVEARGEHELVCAEAFTTNNIAVCRTSRIGDSADNTQFCGDRVRLADSITLVGRS